MLSIFCIVAVSVIAQPEPERELRNYAAELNAPILAIPVEERAWTVYKRAILALEPAPEWFESGWPDEPTQEQIDEATKYLARNKDAIKLVREAASMPHLGYVLQNAREPEFERALAAKEGREPDLRTPSENPLVPGLILMNVTYLRELSLTLMVDCRVAGLAGDEDRLETDLIALLNLSTHAQEQPFMVSYLASLSRASDAFEEIRWALAYHREVLSDDKVLRIRERLRSGWPERRIRTDVDSIMIAIEAVHRRAFDPDGLLNAHGLAILRTLTGIEDFDEQTAAKVLKVWQAVLANESEMRQKLMESVSLIEDYIQTPLWLQDNPTCNEQTDELLAGAPLRYGFVALMVPSGDDIARVGEYATLVRDATLVSIAFELFRREHGSFPESLDELVPAFLAEVPLDRFDGKPLKYHLMQSGPVLYSVGTDRDDDGGKAAKVGHALNWFTPTEVEAARRGEPGAPTIPDGDWILFPPGG